MAELTGVLAGVIFYLAWALLLAGWAVTSLLSPGYSSEAAKAALANPAMVWLTYGPAPVFLYLGKLAGYRYSAWKAKKSALNPAVTQSLRAQDLINFAGLLAGFLLWLALATAAYLAGLSLPPFVALGVGFCVTIGLHWCAVFLGYRGALLSGKVGSEK